MNIHSLLNRLLSYDEYEIVAFYPYTSIVTNRLVETNINYSQDTDELLEQLLMQVRHSLSAQLPQARWDNKVVIAFKIPALLKLQQEASSTLFLGSKDGMIHLGLGMYQPDSYTHNHNLIR